MAPLPVAGLIENKRKKNSPKNIYLLSFRVLKVLKAIYSKILRSFEDFIF
jgi:hypothetical protein